jgi:hypothetical protein
MQTEFRGVRTGLERDTCIVRLFADLMFFESLASCCTPLSVALGCSIAEAVSRWLPTVAAQV